MLIRKTSGKKRDPYAVLQKRRRIVRILSRLSTPLAAMFVHSMFFTPQPISVQRREKAIMASAHVRHDLCCNKRSITVYEWGAGPTLLLVHGWGSRASRLCHLVPALTGRGFRVVAFDAPAHGLSQGRQTSLAEMQPVLKALQHRYGPLSGIVAHSFGALATVYGLAHGLEAERVVLISMPSRFADLVHQFSTGLELNAAVSSALERCFQRRFAAFGASFADVAQHFSPVNYVHDVRACALIVHDRDDRQIACAESEKLAHAWPAAELMLTRGLGHMRILHDAAVIDRIGDFLERPCPGADTDGQGRVDTQHGA